MADNEGKQPAPTLDLDDPEKRRRVVRLLLMMSPGVFVFCYLLAWVQGAEPRHSLLIAAVGAAMTAGAAVAIHLFGSKAIWLIPLIKLAVFVAKK